METIHRFSIAGFNLETIATLESLYLLTSKKTKPSLNVRSFYQMANDQSIGIPKMFILWTYLHLKCSTLSMLHLTVIETRVSPQTKDNETRTMHRADLRLLTLLRPNVPEQGYVWRNVGCLAIAPWRWNYWAEFAKLVDGRAYWLDNSRMARTYLTHALRNREWVSACKSEVTLARALLDSLGGGLESW